MAQTIHHNYHKGICIIFVFFNFVALWRLGTNPMFAESDEVFAIRYLVLAQCANINCANTKCQMCKMVRILWEKWVGANFHAFCDYAVKRALVQYDSLTKS